MKFPQGNTLAHDSFMAGVYYANRAEWMAKARCAKAHPKPYPATPTAYVSLAKIAHRQYLAKLKTVCLMTQEFRLAG